MANDWLRLWHDMPNDPKWRTISRLSGQPISLVISVYVHLLVDASRNVTRGHVDVTEEDIASALDVDEAEINRVLAAMEGRVIEQGALTGWDKRQPKREDSGNLESGVKSASERKRRQREREKANKTLDDVTQCHAMSRNVTLDTDTEEDTDKDKTNSVETTVVPDVSVGAEPKLVSTPPASKPDPEVLRIPLAGKAEDFIVTQSHVAELAESYPGVDTLRSLKACRQWSIDNPARRKTQRGIRKHISAWLGSDQDKGRNPRGGNGQARASPTRFLTKQERLEANSREAIARSLARHGALEGRYERN